MIYISMISWHSKIVWMSHALERKSKEEQEEEINFVKVKRDTRNHITDIFHCKIIIMETDFP
jgi:hypothetical protein